MMEFGRLPNARAAQALVDYLKSRGIDCHISPVAEGVSLSVVKPQDLAAAQAEFENFLRHPGDEKYLAASWETGSTDTQLNYGSPGLALLSRFVTAAGPITLTIFALCILVYGAFNLGFAEPTYALLSFFGASGTDQSAEIWRVFTPTLMHFSLMHISFNLLWWWYLGGKIETRIGSWPLMILLLVAGTLPNLIQYYVSGPNFGGLSGVVYAVAGYTFVMGIRKPSAGIDLPPSYMGFMLVWLVLGFFDFLGLSMANGAHLGGLSVGLLQGFWDSRRR
ncbi:rhomboid family intramembrane serine protease GlpG [Shewanella litorisediminis]|uniref:Rhomboid family intramembrane serine protease GlpG n=1 Tax=Shewanella litorisediminis TaxID=1173586 RepID=A0ABX7G8E2_9GAMM|nr:rhomboid family intramembrane serine protease GlpG [Shewanella litorisediminis]MCL2919434.1 rhomboid family intramembrane serine protease GlpG [Shewanella litorisediminis]QRH03534.1 rhomboid family intramembrane serine protease GlpG [Shewanella litorisediminis]